MLVYGTYARELTKEVILRNKGANSICQGGSTLVRRSLQCTPLEVSQLSSNQEL